MQLAKWLRSFVLSNGEKQNLARARRFVEIVYCNLYIEERLREATGHQPSPEVVKRLKEEIVAYALHLPADTYPTKIIHAVDDFAESAIRRVAA